MQAFGGAVKELDGKGKEDVRAVFRQGTFQKILKNSKVPSFSPMIRVTPDEFWETTKRQFYKRITYVSAGSNTKYTFGFFIALFSCHINNMLPKVFYQDFVHLSAVAGYLSPPRTRIILKNRLSNLRATEEYQHAQSADFRSYRYDYSFFDYNFIQGQGFSDNFIRLLQSGVRGSLFKAIAMQTCTTMKSTKLAVM